MVFEEAKREFGIRYYLWATSEFEKEIEGSFPSFRASKIMTVADVHQYMQQLSKSDQLTLAHALLKRFHPEAVKALGEASLEEEEVLLARRDAFHPTRRAREKEIRERRLACEKITFASKRKLRKVMTAKFREAFGDLCFGMASVDEEPHLKFKMKCCGWILMTNFWFGRRESLIDYTQGVVSESTFEHRGNQVPAMIFPAQIHLCSWLGISGMTKREYLMNEDVEPACDAVIKYCGHFFDIAPKLLKGLEAEKVTPG